MPAWSHSPVLHGRAKERLGVGATQEQNTRARGRGGPSHDFCPPKRGAEAGSAVHRHSMCTDEAAAICSEPKVTLINPCWGVRKWSPELLG